MKCVYGQVARNLEGEENLCLLVHIIVLYFMIFNISYSNSNDYESQENIFFIRERRKERQKT